MELNRAEAQLIAYVYEAGLNRNGNIDEPGLNFWINSREAGQTERQVADAFLRSPEFTAAFGAVDDLSDFDFVTALYENVLNRTADDPGRDFWLSVLADPNVTRADLLLAFARTPENVVNSPLVRTLVKVPEEPLDWQFVTDRYGVVIEGADPGDRLGRALTTIGDLDGDGLEDFAIGAAGDENQRGGGAVVIPGSFAGYPDVLDAGDLSAVGGTELLTPAEYGQGFAASLAGGVDFNDDGIDDLIIGARSTRSPEDAARGTVWVLYGQEGGFPDSIDFTSLTPQEGVRMFSTETGAGTGTTDVGNAVAGIGDVNADGIEDILIGSGQGIGPAYVVYGSETPGETIDLFALDGSNGFAIPQDDRGDRLGTDVAGGFDFNGDGVPDFAVAAQTARIEGTTNTSAEGSVWLVFGRDESRPGVEPFGAELELGNIDGFNGVRINGVAVGDNLGRVSALGDFNGDGLDDIVLGAQGVDAGDLSNAGAAYVIYGTRAFLPEVLDLDDLDGSDGFRIEGPAASSLLNVVEPAGDVDGDGLADLLIGLSRSNAAAGGAFLLYGEPTGTYEPSVALSDIPALGGIEFVGDMGGTNGDNAGGSVASAGDVNGDGFDDLLIGAASAFVDAERQGKAFLIHGGDPALGLFDLEDGEADGVIDLALIGDEVGL